MVTHEGSRSPVSPDVALDVHVLNATGVSAGHVGIIDHATGSTVARGDIADRIGEFARFMTSHGVDAGDVVAVALSNGSTFPVAFFGAMRAAAACTTVNPALTPSEIATQLRSSGACVLVVAPTVLDKAREAVRRAGTGAGVVEIGDTPRDFLRVVDKLPRDRTTRCDSDVAAMPYSSGTSGLPKGVMLSHRNLIANTEQCGVWGMGTDDVTIAVAPFFHIMGMACVLANSLRRGTTLVTMPRFDLRGFLDAVQRHRVTCAVLAPAVVTALAHDPLVDDYDLTSLRFIGSGSAPLSAETQQRCAERLRCPVDQAWGMSECGLGTASAPGRGKTGSSGPPVTGAELRVIDPVTGADLPAGVTGELLIRGPNVMRGYLRDPAATAAVLNPDGWLHTGDAAMLDTDGHLTVVDRYKELIKYKGFQVAPAELEAILRAHPAVLDAAVVPSPDDAAGEVPKAFLVLRPDTESPTTAQQIVDWASNQLATYKHIRRVEVVDSVPRSPTGKLLRRVLTERERH